jgi:hypothetical protein
MATQELGKSTYGMPLCKKFTKNWEILDGLAGNCRHGTSFKQSSKFCRNFTSQIRQVYYKNDLKIVCHRTLTKSSISFKIFIRVGRHVTEGRHRGWYFRVITILVNLIFTQLHRMPRKSGLQKIFSEQKTVHRISLITWSLSFQHIKLFCRLFNNAVSETV